MPKPILSDSLFNADDVATAILNKANLSITNENLGVTDISDKFVRASTFQYWIDHQAYSFNGFVFFNLVTYKSTNDSDFVSSGMNAYTINDSNYYPVKDTWLPSSSHQGDTPLAVMAKTTGEIFISLMHEQGVDSNFHVVCNGFFRIN